MRRASYPSALRAVRQWFNPGRASLGSLVAIPVIVASSLAPTSARAVDGCLVLLCFAAPSWRAIPECVPPIREVLRDLARGRPFPTCAMAGAGNSARHSGPLDYAHNLGTARW